MSAPTDVPTRPLGGIVDGLGRAGLVLAAVAVAVAVGLLGTHHASLDELREAIASGQVHEVRVAGTLPPGASGFTTAYVRWSADGFDRLTTVRQVSDLTYRDGTGPDWVRGSIEADLRQAQGSGVLRIVHDESVRPTGGSMLGIDVPSWVAGGAVLVWVLTVLLLVAGPEPSRATRWGWFWLLLSALAPLATVVFLVAGEPAHPVPGAPGARRRLGGVRAFVLVLLLGGFAWSAR
jgi:hypothetical protein